MTVASRLLLAIASDVGYGLHITLVTLANSDADERFGLFVGSKVVYTRLVADHRDLYIVNGDGSDGRVLSSNADDKQPVAVF
jgi:hypothetical protein